jgi:hypothetical protein
VFSLPPETIVSPISSPAEQLESAVGSTACAHVYFGLTTCPKL